MSASPYLLRPPRSLQSVRDLRAAAEFEARADEMHKCFALCDASEAEMVQREIDELRERAARLRTNSALVKMFGGG